MKKIILLAALAVTLSACVVKTDKRHDDSAHWGNYKCVTQSDGRSYQGWSTNKADAKHNSMAICEEQAKTGCQFVSCDGTA